MPQNIAIYNQDMARAEEQAERLGLTVAAMMGNAGSAVVNFVRCRFPQSKTLVVCGPGNNGGDGVVAATLLKKLGWPVTILCDGHNPHLSRLHVTDYLLITSDINVSEYSIVIDAVFGTGLTRDIDHKLHSLFNQINSSAAAVVAVDIPSGINGNTGQVMGCAIKADCTITFQATKLGHVLYPGQSFAGELVVADIGISDGLLPKSIMINSDRLWGDIVPKAEFNAHKYSRGHLMVIGGAMPGASILAASACQKSASGIVTLCHSPQHAPTYGFPHAPEFDSQAPNHRPRGACMAIPPSIIQTTITPESIGDFIKNKKVSAATIGQGFGGDAKDYLALLLHADIKLVIDADALTAPGCVTLLRDSNIPKNAVLTPHMGEFVRLFPDISTDDRVAAARAAAKISNAVVVLKGASTVIAAPDGQAIINSRAPFGLATAGSGDVLTGIIGGLLSAGMPTFLGAAAGVWIHSRCAETSNHITAEGLIDNLQIVFDNLYDRIARRNFVTRITC